jgi:putative hydrolase
LRRALRGDCHLHSDWSDGGSPIEEMALAAVSLGHEYMVLTDHSPRLTVARGLSAAKLRRQLRYVAEVNAALPEGFRILTGIEVDILADGALDQEPELLAELDLVVASVHSGLRDDPRRMTRRMVRAVENPLLDILGHCTGRKVPAVAVGLAAGGDRAHRAGRTRPPSEFDADEVFAACAAHDKAVEINSRPDRFDPPKRLLRRAVEAGCRFAVDSDAHAPGQLDWLRYGCERAVRCGVDPGRVVNTWPAARLVDWTAGHRG